MTDARRRGLRTALEEGRARLAAAGLEEPFPQAEILLPPALRVPRGAPGEPARPRGVGGRAGLLLSVRLGGGRGPAALVARNPPSVGTGEPVAPGVPPGPRGAVFGGPDGLEAYARLAPAAARVLRP